MTTSTVRCHPPQTVLTRLLPLLALAATTACSSGPSGSVDAQALAQDLALDLIPANPEAGAAGDAAPGDAAPGDAATVSCDHKAQPCASTFGSLFTKSNGRADGKLVAVVRPSDTQCALFNSTHVVVQLSILGQVQRLVVSVKGVAVTSVSSKLVGPAYAEGWHTSVNLDYVSDLGAHSDDFALVSMDKAVDFICSPLSLGAPVSVYAYSDGSYPASAHQVHRNDKYPDGAIVMDPTSAKPTYLLFRYANQVF